MRFAASALETDDKPTFYADLGRQLSALIDGETDRIANLANAAALIHDQVPDLNWSGFYLLQGEELVLGPFQGKPACVRIPLGQGVCGTAAASRQTLRVADVHTFPGHIACDTRSRAELVVPLIAGDRLLGVLDLDSPTAARFDCEDETGLQHLADLLAQHL
ncbi:GAF domain-containing protein [Arboricoccus pini]|uniref:GAF domain-containing protein n=1 Tax=Arboricoccus pini TaxID=1963835 RepID=A0A212QQB1_9PROT|nr:GAF domain-containing protein [Arboricoccus pini]SNB61675.1 GAF domain-containing protein [Arboricoccus pini]